ncbi:MAG: stage V sporulation protein AB [Romboutsia sp.]
MKLFIGIFGFSSGIMVGSGVVSILILIGIIPRMARISNTKQFTHLYETLLVMGTIFGSIIYLHNIHINLGRVGAVITGLAYGIFIGLLSSGLTEILDYIPVVSRRLNIDTSYLKYIIWSLLIGKVIGSFFGWKII